MTRTLILCCAQYSRRARGSSFLEHLPRLPKSLPIPRSSKFVSPSLSFTSFMSPLPNRAHNRFGVDINQYLGTEELITYRRGVCTTCHGSRKELTRDNRPPLRRQFILKTVLLSGKPWYSHKHSFLLAPADLVESYVHSSSSEI